MTQVIEVLGLEEVIEKLDNYPKMLNEMISETTEASLLTLWENVPPYPPEPENSTYRRMGTLGRSLGSGAQGGKDGQPDIMEVRPLGSGVGYEGQFGSRLDYAPLVIGDDLQAGHMGHWWKISKVAELAADKINRLYQTMVDKLVEFMNGSRA